MQIVREVERDILRREEQKREEQTLIDEVKPCIGLEPPQSPLTASIGIHLPSKAHAGKVSREFCADPFNQFLQISKPSSFNLGGCYQETSKKSF